MKDWSLKEWIQNFLQDENVYYEDPYEEFYDDTITASDGEPMGDEMDADLDGIFESFLILSLVASIMFLMWYRTQRQQAHRQAQEDAARQQPGAPGMPPAAQNGMPLGQQQPPPLGDPHFAQWGAGGVGH
jgi:SEL1 protein